MQQQLDYYTQVSRASERKVAVIIYKVSIVSVLPLALSLVMYACATARLLVSCAALAVDQNPCMYKRQPDRRKVKIALRIKQLYWR
jgi:hypothetical protein